jgi:hypothetical protein
LWCNRQTEAGFVLRPKPRNHRGDFEVQITKPDMLILRPKPGNPSHQVWSQTRENYRRRLCGQTGENRATCFEAKPKKTVATGFEVKTGENRLSGFEAKPLTNRRPWVWGSTKKPLLLISTCTVQTAHSATWRLDRPAT